MPRLLVVEDDEDMRFAFTLMLEREGHDVQAVPSAEIAMDALRSDSFDLLLTDLLLPGVDGAELCRMVRAEEQWAAMPIVVITAMMARMGIDITDADTYWMPADRIIDKAAPVEKLLEAIRELLSEDRG